MQKVAAAEAAAKEQEGVKMTTENVEGEHV